MNSTCTMTYVEAAIAALREEMQRDASVWALGEDLGRGGVFGQYKGLQNEFGPARIADTPISEAAIMGAALGAAMTGTRPVVEMRFSDFALCAVDELVNQAAKARYMFGGQARAPLVVREPVGMWGYLAAQHSQSLESWYTHIPGLVVLAPATARDAKGLLKAAIRCDDPVVLLEHKNLWPMRGEVANGMDALTPIGKADVARSGKDITLVSWSAMVHECLAAADILASEGIEAEVIDLRSLWPWDEEAVFASLRKTGRLVIVQEAVTTSGFGAEIAARVAETCHSDLKSPIQRLGSPRVPIPYAPLLENELKVSPQMITAAVKLSVRS